MRLALYQPDIPQNAGTLLRLSACLSVPLDIIEPAGFVLTDAKLKRAGMDYLSSANLTRHDDWEAFRAAHKGHRLVLLTTQGAEPYTDFTFSKSDILLLGRESAGVPEGVHGQCDARLFIPMAPGQRSLNVAVAGAMVLGEALRQLTGFPPPASSE